MSLLMALATSHFVFVPEGICAHQRQGDRETDRGRGEKPPATACGPLQFLPYLSTLLRHASPRAWLVSQTLRGWDSNPVVGQMGSDSLNH